MSVLSTIQDAAKEMGLPTPSSIYLSSDRFATEMGALAKECASYIARFHNWQLFLTLNTVTGDGSATEFDLPDDFDRMPVKAGVFRSSTTRRMEPVRDLDEWLARRLQNINNPTGEWIILGGQIQVFPVLSNTETAKFYYCSNLIAADNVDAPKAAFTTDTDQFRLSERLLKLCLKWRWRAMKKLDSADEQEDFQLALAEEVKKDKGSMPFLTVGRPRLPADVEIAWPGTINA